MKTTGDEFFYRVPGLSPPKGSVKDTLVEDIGFFVDWLHNNSDSINFLFEHHIKSFIYVMKMLHDILGGIYARWLANDAAKILKVAETNSTNLCGKLIPPFMVNAHSLAIDIQMAQRNSSLRFVSDLHSEMESFKDVISVAKIIVNLLKKLDFGQAISFAQDLPELSEGEYGVPLIESMKAGDEKRAMTLINTIISAYTKKVDDINISVAQSSGMKTIVVVDDMPEILTALYHMLKEYYQVLAFTEGFQALDCIDNIQQADAFLLDLDMPGMDGFALAQSIRERERYKTTPIIILTSFSSKEAIVQARYYDVKAFIVKPAEKDIIISKLGSCFNQ